MIAEFQITSLDDLLDYLPNALPSEYKSMAKDMSLDVSDFERYMTWKPNKYTRNCIVRTEAYELLLLCWDEGQETSIHCHGGEECWVYNVEGEIEEKNYKLVDGLPVEVHNEVMNEGEVSYMNDDLGYHKLTNISSGRSISLHLYMNPIDSCTTWSSEEKKFIPVELKYDTLEGRAL